MLRCDGCRVRAGEFALQLDRLRVAPGEHCLVVGPSGAGKSLLLRAVAGLVRPETGTIMLRGEDAASLPPEVRRVGLVFQHYSLFPHLSARDNVAFGLRRRGTGRRDAHAQAAAMLDRLGCAHLADRRPSTLSGGEQQRVAIARALATGVDLLLLDEPFAALDPFTRAACRIELAALRRSLGLTILEVTHALEEAASHADRVVILDSGRIVAEGPFEAIAARPPNLRAARALGLENLLPAGILGGEDGAWCFVPPTSVAVDSPEAAVPDGALALPGTVETVEDLGPSSRVRLLVDGAGDRVRLSGFAAGGVGALQPGSRATARFPADSVLPLHG
jgi:ABC-type Fe3+/spermidine/putrescine transport system ATPase subunit